MVRRIGLGLAACLALACPDGDSRGDPDPTPASSETEGRVTVEWADGEADLGGLLIHPDRSITRTGHWSVFAGDEVSCAGYLAFHELARTAYLESLQTGDVGAYQQATRDAMRSELPGTTLLLTFSFESEPTPGVDLAIVDAVLQRDPAAQESEILLYAATGTARISEGPESWVGEGAAKGLTATFEVETCR